MTAEELVTIGFKPFNLNGVTAYYWPVQGAGFGRNDVRLEVVFYPDPDVPFMAWLCLPSYNYILRHITTAAQLQTLHGLLAGARDSGS